MHSMTQPTAQPPAIPKGNPGMFVSKPQAAPGGSQFTHKISPASNAGLKPTNTPSVPKSGSMSFVSKN